MHTCFVTWILELSNGFISAITDPAIKLVPLQDIPLKDLLKYDTNIHKIPREWWVQQCYENYNQSVAAINENGDICGYAVFYPMPDSNKYKLQPLLADEPRIAKQLLKHVLDKLPESCGLIVKIPEDNPDAVVLFKSIGVTPETPFQSFIMYNKHKTYDKLQMPVHKIYSVMNGNNQFA